MRLEHWQSLGVISGTLLALVSLVGLLWRRVVRPVWRAAWRTIRRLNQVADDLLGDPAKKIPSLRQRLEDLERTQVEHLQWHASPPGPPARPRPEVPNSTRRESGR